MLKKRRMSQPITKIEKTEAIKNHNLNNKKETSNKEANQNIINKNYEKLSIYPSVNRLVAIGDLHGDLKESYSS